MNYLLDTVAVVRHFSGNPAIGMNAKEILKNADNDSLFYISVISLMEIMYLSEKNRIPLGLDTTLNKIKSSSLYSIVDLTTDILKVTEKIKFYELHDRVILATAKWLGVPVLSSDIRFREIKDLNIIWE